MIKLAFYFFILTSTALFAFGSSAQAKEVYVETNLDTDHDGKPDRIYVQFARPETTKKLSTILEMTPYDTFNNVENHGVDLDFLPQDDVLQLFFKRAFQGFKTAVPQFLDFLPENQTQYIRMKAHSLGTGKSTGCPSVGDLTEALAGKAVIDWLNGRTKAYYQNGQEAEAYWANGKVGMSGVSYNGTLPIMVAATGVKELKAIVPIAAISSWYDYYRSNGLVVNPGGYIGEDADTLGAFIIRKDGCAKTVQNISHTMGRENGDYTQFWQNRDYIARAKNIQAATFIIHGQSDWNVKQKNAIQLWEALENVVPRRLFLHRNAHGTTNAHAVPQKIQAWFDHFLNDEENGVTNGPAIEVELMDGSLVQQRQWPNETTRLQKLYFNENGSLSITPSSEKTLTITDSGKKETIEKMADQPAIQNPGRLAFLSQPFSKDTLLSGTPNVQLNFSILNRKAANITVALVEYTQTGKTKIITRGWADPQNYRNLTQGELLTPGQNYTLSFNLEPKQIRIAAGSKIGALLASTDYEYTLRPDTGTQIQFNIGSAKSFIELNLSP